MAREKRRSRRKQVRNMAISLRPLDPQVWFRFWSGTECTLRDISLVGVGVYARDNIPVGTLLSINLRLGKRASTIRVFGKIAWSCEESGRYRTGISFSWWKDDQDKIHLSNFLEKLMNTN